MYHITVLHASKYLEPKKTENNNHYLQLKRKKKKKFLVVLVCSADDEMVRGVEEGLTRILGSSVVVVVGVSSV